MRGTDEYDTRAVQVAEEAKSLNSGDCFVLVTPEVVYAWKGNHANPSEHTVCESIAATLKEERSIEILLEGSEPDAFWTALGGKGDYPKGGGDDEDSRDPMLFQCSNATGSLEMEPVFDFAQGDLCEDDVFIMDTFTTIWIWIGKEANEAEKRGADEAAIEYIKVNGYEEKTPVVKVHSGSEPSIFTCHFLGWDATKAEGFIDPYEAKLKAALAANPAEEEEGEKKPGTFERRESVGAAAIFENKEFLATASDPKPSDATDISYEQNYATFSYEDLKKPVGELPAGVDPRKKEAYLTDEVFVKVLGSPRGVFEKLKPWKQQQLKKAAGLF